MKKVYIKKLKTRHNKNKTNNIVKTNNRYSKHTNLTDFILVNNKVNIYDGYKEYVQLIDYVEYKKTIIESYHFNNTAIINQFDKDFPRSIYYISKTQETDIELFKDYFEFFLYQKHLNFYEFTMFLTQAVMGMPLEILSKDIVPNIYIGEISNSYNPMQFKIIIDKSNLDDIQLYITKKLRYFYINNKGIDVTINIVNIKIFIPFSTKDKIIITYKILKNKDSSII